MPICGIYSIKEISTGKIYIGQSVDIKRRWSKHRKTRPTTLYEYNIEQLCCRGILNMLEIYFIKKLNTLEPNGLNIQAGGQTWSMVYTEEMRKRLSEAFTGRVFSDEHKEKIGAAHKGRVFSEETRRKMSESAKKRRASKETREKMSAQRLGRKGKPRSEEVKNKISEKLMGHKQSEDTRRKKSEAHKGKIIPQETRDKLSKANKGKRLSDEAKKRMIESNKKTWARKNGREYIPPDGNTEENTF